MNKTICKNCSAENPFYELICRKCKAYIRERVVNIDLWKTIAAIIESPSKGFTIIIHAEHKNFVYLIITLSALKYLLNFMLLSQVTSDSNNPFEHFVRNYFISLSFILILLWIFAAVEKIFLNWKENETRLKDNFAVLSYSLLPHVFGLLILFPIELVIFGGFLFSNNPSPFILKESIAYTLLVFEALVILWQLFLTTVSFFVQTRRLTLSLLFSFIFNLLLYYILYLFSHLII